MFNPSLKYTMLYLYIKLLMLTLLLFDVKIATASATRNNCPRGWTDATEYGMGCLLFNVNQTTTWPEAQHFCYNLEHDAALVEIYSVMQQEFMEEKSFEIEAIPYLYILFMKAHRFVCYVVRKDLEFVRHTAYSSTQEMFLAQVGI